LSQQTSTVWGLGDVGLKAILYYHGIMIKVGLVASANRPFPLYGTGLDDVAIGSESQIQARMPISGVFKNMLINKTVSTIQGGVGLRKNGAGTAISCSALGTGETDSGASEVTVVAGDLVNFSINPNTSGNLTLTRISIEFHES